MKRVKKIKLFISCPSDIKNELDSIRLIIDEINKTSGEQGGYVIQSLNWKSDTYTDIGEDGQDVINNQVDSKYDILVSLIWLKLGTPTKRDISGTVEEINRAITNKKQFLIYFNTAPPEDLKQINIKELEKVNLFREDLIQRGVLIKEYNSISIFESLFRINMSSIISDKFLTKTKNPTKTQKTTKLKKSEIDPYLKVTSVINRIEQQLDDPNINLDIFTLVEEILSSLANITQSMNSITDSTNDFGAKLEKRTAEITRFSKIKDDRVRATKTKTIFDLMGTEMDEFNLRISNELPVFSVNLKSIGPNYSKILLYANQYESSQVGLLQHSISEFRSSIEGATNMGADMLQTMLSWPPVNPKFSSSKRALEITMKNLVKEMLEGLKLLDEVVEL